MFSGFTEINLVNPCPGVYFLCSYGIVVYIGSSRNVMARVGVHSKRMKSFFNRAYYFPVDPEHRKYAEYFMIYRYQPVYNKGGKDSPVSEDHPLFATLEAIPEGPWVNVSDADLRRKAIEEIKLARFVEKHRDKKPWRPALPRAISAPQGVEGCPPELSRPRRKERYCRTFKSTFVSLVVGSPYPRYGSECHQLIADLQGIVSPGLLEKPPSTVRRVSFISISDKVRHSFLFYPNGSIVQEAGDPISGRTCRDFVAAP